MGKFESRGGLTRRDMFYGMGIGAGAAMLNGRLAFAEDIWKVAWAQVGPVGDAGWTYQQDVARREVEKQLARSKTMQVENVSPSDMQRAIEDFIGQGAKVLMVQEPTVMDIANRAWEEISRSLFPRRQCLEVGSQCRRFLRAHGGAVLSVRSRCRQDDKIQHHRICGTVSGTHHHPGD